VVLGLREEVEGLGQQLDVAKMLRHILEGVEETLHHTSAVGVEVERMLRILEAAEVAVVAMQCHTVAPAGKIVVEETKRHTLAEAVVEGEKTLHTVEEEVVVTMQHHNEAALPHMAVVGGRNRHCILPLADTRYCQEQQPMPKRQE
jgi:hypothetical protein